MRLCCWISPRRDASFACRAPYRVSADLGRLGDHTYCNIVEATTCCEKFMIALYTFLNMSSDVPLRCA